MIIIIISSFLHQVVEKLKFIMMMMSSVVKHDMLSSNCDDAIAVGIYYAQQRMMMRTS
jgi:hypothetical protein